MRITAETQQTPGRRKPSPSIERSKTMEDLHPFDKTDEDLMRGRRTALPTDRRELAAHIEGRVAQTRAIFNSAEMARMPASARAATDAEAVGLLKRRFRAALAESLKLSDLARSEGMEEHEEAMEKVASRTRAALDEIDLGRGGRFAPLLPSVMNSQTEETSPL